MRIKWWEDPANLTYKEISVEKIDSLPDIKIDPNMIIDKNYYKGDEKPVFFGHYWLKGVPKIIKDNPCCLDYSVAKGGLLVAYRYDDEQKLDNNKIVYV